MSNATPTTLRTPADGTRDGFVRTIRTACLEGVRAIAFWTAVLLPLVMLLLLASGTTVGGLTMLGLVGANVTCAVVGHDYSR